MNGLGNSQSKGAVRRWQQAWRSCLFEAGQDLLEPRLWLAHREHGMPVKVQRKAAVEELVESGDKGNGEDAMKALERICHLKMPMKGGLEVLNWIRKNPLFKNLVVAILSSSSNEDDITNAYKHHANSYLVKPASLEALTDMTRRIKGYWLELNQNPDERK